MINLGDNNVTLKLGDNDVSKVYLGETQIYPSAPATNLVMRRISDTEYLVTGDGGTANLTFTRESDSLVDAKGVQGLPYTFTHSLGEKWSVNGVNAWAVDIPLEGYLEAQNMTDLELANYMKTSFYWNGITTDANAMVFGKIVNFNDNYRWVVSILNNKIGLWSITTGAVELAIDLRNESISAGWNVFEISINGSQVTQTLNGVSNTYTVDDSKLAYTTNNEYFRIGREYSGLERRFVGKVQYYEHGSEIFTMQEGTGNVVGTEGTTLIQNGTSWEKV